MAGRKMDWVIAAVVCLHLLSSSVQADWVLLPTREMQALQALLGAWNGSTADLNSSLPGWKTFNASDVHNDPCFLTPWRGIFCYIDLNETRSAERAEDDRIFEARVVSIDVSDASIVGTLPVDIWNFWALVTLILTGNPGLTGPLPLPPLVDQGDSTGWEMKSIDLHGNGFNGAIPAKLFTYFQYLEDIDLSNNRLEGPLPATLGLNEKLRTLNLSNNTLEGNMPLNISGNWTKAVSVDLSSNRFTGNMPNLSYVEALHTLNLSRNNFAGQIDLSVFNSSTKKTLVKLDLSNNKFTGPMPNFGDWLNLSSLSLSSNSFDPGPCPPWLSNLTRLESLDLSRSFLKGELDLAMFRSLERLESLELNDNNLIGTLNIDSLHTSGSSLTTVRLRRNQITKVVFGSNNVSSLKGFTIELQDNPYCDEVRTDLQRCLCEQSCFNTDLVSSKMVIIGSSVAGSIALVLLVIVAILYWKNRRDRRYLLLAVQEKFAEYEMKPTLFAYSELQKATRDFHPDNKLGEGAFGTVYKGTLADGSVVAVKQLLTKAQENMDDFLNEVVLLTSVKHRNLVKLKGCCLRGDKRLMVYEFIDNSDLAETLFEHRGNQVLTWPARFNICLGVAHGLHYLHAGVEPRIIHRDIKANNVLLDQSMHPKIADFGLAMLFPNEVDTHITIVQIAGTKGYLAPEYATRGQVSDKVDVFSFGVLALEVVSGRKNICFDQPPDKSYLTDWAWKLNEEGRLMELIDSTLPAPTLSEEAEMLRVITTALACIQTGAERRPSMAQVVGMLQGDIEIMESERGSLTEDNRSHHIGLLGLSSSSFTPGASSSSAATRMMPTLSEESSILQHYRAENSSSSAVLNYTSISAR